MKSSQQAKAISRSDLERFILLFLPELKIDSKTPELELSTITINIVRVLECIELSTSINDIFEAFRNLSYPIAVIEPQNENIKGQPYSDTNSHAIYIGVNLDKLKELSSIPDDFNNANNKNIHFLKKYASTIKN